MMYPALRCAPFTRYVYVSIFQNSTITIPISATVNASIQSNPYFSCHTTATSVTCTVLVPPDEIPPQYTLPILVTTNDTTGAHDRLMESTESLCTRIDGR